MYDPSEGSYTNAQYRFDLLSTKPQQTAKGEAKLSTFRTMSIYIQHFCWLEMEITPSPSIFSWPNTHSSFRCHKHCTFYWAQWNSLLLEEERVLENDNWSTQKIHIVVLINKVSELLRYLHDGSLEGYLAVTNTLQKVRERFCWINSSEYVKECNVFG